jgi:hypothetical protein
MPHESAREVFERGEQAVGRLGDMRRRMRILVTDHHHTPPDRTARLAELSSQIDELRERISADESSVAEMERVIAQVGEKSEKWGRALRLRYRKGLNVRGVARMISTSDSNAGALIRRGTAYADKLLAG